MSYDVTITFSKCLFIEVYHKDRDCIVKIDDFYTRYSPGISFSTKGELRTVIEKVWFSYYESLNLDG